MTIAPRELRFDIQVGDDRVRIWAPRGGDTNDSTQPGRWKMTIGQRRVEIGSLTYDNTSGDYHFSTRLGVLTIPAPQIDLTTDPPRMVERTPFWTIALSGGGGVPTQQRRA